MDQNLRRKQILTTVAVSAGSAAIGAFFGILSVLLYDFDSEVPFFVVPLAGGGLGAAAAVVYMWILRRMGTRFSSRRWFIRLGILLGMVFGVVCSTLHHLFLIWVTGTESYFTIFIGALFGMPLGLLLGSAASRNLWNGIHPESETVKG